MVDLKKLEQLVRTKAAAAGDQKVLDLSSAELQEILVQCIYDHIYQKNLQYKKGES